MQRSRELCASAMHHRNLVMFAIGKIHNGTRTLMHEFFVIEGRAADLDHDSQFRPSCSSKPNITFMFWTACPAAPFIKLSRHETKTRRLPSALKLKQVVRNTRRVLAIELLTATRGLDLLRPLRSSPIIEGVRERFAAVCAPWTEDRPLGPDIDRAAAWLEIIEI